MPALVLDASIALAAILPGEAGAEIAAAVIAGLSGEPAAVPELWCFETANVVAMAVRRKRLDIEQSLLVLARLRTIPVSIDRQSGDHVWDRTFGLARIHGLTLYDAVYLELASRRNLPLATFDQALRRAAEAAGVPLANPPG